MLIKCRREVHAARHHSGSLCILKQLRQFTSVLSHYTDADAGKQESGADGELPPRDYRS